MLSGMGEVWARRGDGVEFGVVPFGEDHPCSSLVGRWHVVVVRPGRPELPLSPPVSEEEARGQCAGVVGVARDGVMCLRCRLLVATGRTS